MGWGASDDLKTKKGSFYIVQSFNEIVQEHTNKKCILWMMDYGYLLLYKPTVYSQPVISIINDA